MMMEIELVLFVSVVELVRGHGAVKTYNHYRGRHITLYPITQL